MEFRVFLHPLTTNRITTPPSPIDDPTDLDDEIDLDVIIKELMGEGGVDDEELEINGLTKKELKWKKD